MNYSMEWIKISEQLPEPWSQHKNIFESDEVLLDCGDFHIVSKYVRKYDHDLKSLLFEGFDVFPMCEQDIVERWCKITR